MSLAVSKSFFLIMPCSKKWPFTLCTDKMLEMKNVHSERSSTSKAVNKHVVTIHC